jgi:hypothetical protein
MKSFEIQRLLPSARIVARELSVVQAEVPVEGYYSENVQLTEYFKLMRALQEVSLDRRAEVNHLSEFQLLLKTTSSSLYGRPMQGPYLFPSGGDPLYDALAESKPNEWNVPYLVNASYEAAVKNDDYSLVGLAVLIKDAVAITALRESVVLYALAALGASFEEIEYIYEWRVDEDIQKAANRFISTFNDLVPNAIPKAIPENAEYFHNAYTDNEITGRCVRLGYDDSYTPFRHYHWAIRIGQTGLEVDDFWSEEIWTTDDYQKKKLNIMDVS